jgi:hypothetical protein
LLCAVVVVSWPALAAAEEGIADSESGAEQRDLDQARAVYERAVKAYEQRKYVEAIELFKHANQLKPNAAFSFNIGIAYQDMGDAKMALRFYREYLRKVPDAPDRPDVLARVKRLEAQLQQLGVQQVTVVTHPANAAITIDGKPVGLSPWSGEMAPGNHEVIVRLAGFEDAQRAFDLPPDRAIDVSVTLSEKRAAPPPPDEVIAPPPPPKHSPEWYEDVRSVTWGVLGAGVASFGVSVLYEFSRSAAQDDLQTAANNQARDELQATVASRRSWADGFLLLGIGLTATSGALILSDVLEARAARAEETRTRWSGGCTPRGCTIHYQTTF